MFIPSLSHTGESEMDTEQQSEMDTITERSEMEQKSEPTAAELLAELERTRSALKDANKEAADRRKKLEQLEEAENKRKQAEMTELERLQAEKRDAERRAEAMAERYRDTLIRSTVEMTAARLDFHDPADAYALIKRDGLDVDESGKVVGAEEAVKRLAKDKPHLVKPRNAPNINAQDRSGAAVLDLEAEKERLRKTGMYNY